jgi:hypothetical protein
MTHDKIIEIAKEADVQEPYATPNLSELRHSDNCRFWDDGEFCTCGAVEYDELKYWRAKAAKEARRAA